MIYSVSVYSKTGKLRKIISTKNLRKRHWQVFKRSEEARKKFTSNNIGVDCYKLLADFRSMNFICDNLHEDEAWKIT